MKTHYCSYCIDNLPTGCKYCVKGRKLVVFISGICSRNCWYCSLSEKRKNKSDIYANERKIKTTKELIQEAIESKATSAGITGGDPLLFLNRTLKYAKTLKQYFGKSFHIHIYLPTKLVSKSNLEKLSKYIDEIRFHPNLITNPNENIEDIFKIKLASLFWKKQNIGIELPMIPDKKQEILNFIIQISPFIGFVNLNEFELSETNFNIITKKYKLDNTGYVIKASKPAGLWLLNQLKKSKTRLKVHLCTAELKNNFQFKNRLKLHNILAYGRKTKDGTVKYLVLYNKPKQEDYFYDTGKSLSSFSCPKKYKNQVFFDKKKNRYILSEALAKKLIKQGKKVSLVEEFPTFDRIEVEKQDIN